MTNCAYRIQLQQRKQRPGISAAGALQTGYFVKQAGKANALAGKKVKQAYGSKGGNADRAEYQPAFCSHIHHREYCNSFEEKMQMVKINIDFFLT